jgi:glycine oxidase
MSGSAESVDVAIVGGGIIGLSVAWRARAAGLSVTVLERDTLGRGTSYVAAGMLAPVAEAEFGEAGRRLLGLGLRSARMWPAFAAELESASGVEVGLLQTGTIVLARDADAARELERQLVYRRSLGLRAERLRPSDAREREPALAPTVRLALSAPDDHSVDPRRVLTALRRACAGVGVNIREHTPVESIESVGLVESVESVESTESVVSVGGVELDGSRARVTGVALHGGERVQADQVVVAAGAWSGQIDGLPREARVDVRPVKGQILRLRDPTGPGLLRSVARFAGGYLVPRADGRYVLGASVEERGYELTPTAGAVYELLRDASEVVPGVSELQIEELSVGLRPGTPDNVPIIGSSAVAGLTWATGHHRNGILLAPLTAELVVESLAGVLA